MRYQDSVKIGIVLPEDHRQEIFFTTPKETLYYWEAQGIAHSLEREKNYSISKGEQGNLWLCLEGKKIKKASQTAKIYGNFSLLAKNCLEIKNVLAGRHFHWRKEIHQKLPGDFLFTIYENNLVLINLLPLEAYIACVAVSEMSPFCPKALLQAQMIVARSWLLAHAENKHSFWDACNDDCCQRYQGVENLSESLFPVALETEGQVLVQDEKICDTRYSKCCGGITEEASQVWENTAYPYLVSIWDGQSLPEMRYIPDKSQEEDARQWIESSPSCFCSPNYIPQKDMALYLGKVDIAENYYRWEKKYSQEDILECIRNKGQISSIQEVLSLKALERGNSGRIKKLEIFYLNKENQKKSLIISSEYSIRNLLHTSFLYSSAFIIQEEKDSDGHLVSILLKGAGWGHGVGLCQMGALGMALKGYSYQEILSHYFPSTRLESIQKISSKI